ncbi:IS1595 family transposase [Bradyrhizobium sp. NBAIM01]|nr:IS1595 family transposase [Bradyrhizobium sp. NBAIM01]
MGAVEREGEVAAKVLPVANQATMHEFVKETVAPEAKMLATDAHPVYQHLEGHPSYQIVNHQAGEYKGDAHNDSIESVWALLKGQIVGTHHWVSAKHLQQYVQEMTWRLNRRSMSPAECMHALFDCVVGPLPYKVLLAVRRLRAHRQSRRLASTCPLTKRSSASSELTRGRLRLALCEPKRKSRRAGSRRPSPTPMLVKRTLFPYARGGLENGIMAADLRPRAPVAVHRLNLSISDRL